MMDSGCDWLRRCLTEDGAIFVSIDDNEVMVFGTYSTLCLSRPTS